MLFLGVWEQIHNPDFNSLEFEGIRNEAGRNSFFLSVKKWVETTNAKGLIARAGRYGGTYAEFIHMQLNQSERLQRLNEIAIRQMKALTSSHVVKQLAASMEVNDDE